MANTGNIATISGIILTDSGIDLSTKADLVGGLVPSSQLPSYVDDVLEYSALASFPATGEAGKIYVDLATNKIYRWSGSVYVEVSAQVGTTWGGITGTLSNQTDLQTALNGKQASLSGTGFVKSTAGVISYDTNTYLTGNQSISVTGDATGSGTTSIALTLANSGVTAGTYRSVTVDAKGRVTAGTNPTTVAGYGITDIFAQTLGAAYVVGANTAISGADTLEVMLEKLQGQINARQASLSGTGFVKISGTTISYDNSTYLTTATAASTYLPLAGGTLTGALSGTSATFSANFNINTTNAYTSRLNVQAAAANRPAIKAGFGASAGNGYWILGDNYTLDESLSCIGIDYSGGGLVLGSALAPSTTTSGAFISTQAQFGGYGSAIKLGTGGEITFYNGNQNSVIAAGSAKTASVALTIAQTGAATFSSSVTAGGIVTAPSQFQLSGASLPTGLNLGVGGNTPLIELHANFRNSQNTTYRGGELRIDTRDGQPLFSFLSRSAGSTVDNFLLSLSEAGQLKFNNYLTATSFSGTAAGYLAFDSSGNIITVAGVAATDSTKLPLAGGTMTGGLVNQANLSAWGSSTAGLGVGGIHLGAASVTTNVGPAITFGARDASAGANAQAGIYINSDGNYGTRMYLATTDSYAVGSKVAVSISETGVVNFVRANATVQGNGIWHAGNFSPSSYVPLSGGTMTGALQVSMGYPYIQLNDTIGSPVKSAYIQYGVTVGGAGASGGGYFLTYSQDKPFAWSIGANQGLVTLDTSSLGLKVGITSTAPGGSVLLKHAVSEVDVWIFQENAANWGLYYKNNPTGQHTFGGYTTVGAETVGMSAANVSGNGILTSNFVGATTAYAQWMLSNYTGYIWSASTIYAVGDMRTARFYSTLSSGTMFSHGAMTDAIGYNASYGTYIGSPVGGTYYIYGNGQMNNNGTIVTLLHSGNYNSYSPTLTGGNASGTWGINISGTAAAASSATFVSSPDGDRVAGNKLPTSNPRAVRFDFATAGSVTGATGNYAGVMTYAPWDGTSASTGDSSYQLAFINESGVNASGVPGLRFRHGINSTWNGWTSIITSSNYTAYTLPITGGTLTGTRPIQLDTGGGAIFATGNTGGWSMGTYYKGSDNVVKGGFGAYGGGASMNWLWIGVGYDNTWAQINSSAFNTQVALQQNGNQVLHAGNYNSYSPTLTGGGASGTWGINITGNAATATNANQAYSLPTAYAGGQQTNPQVYFSQGTGLKVAMTGAWSVWSDTLWINGYGGGDVLQMCALHTLRNGTPRMAISVQASNSTSYGTFYEFLTGYNYSSFALPLSGGTMSGAIGRASHSSGYFVGSYNNVGGNSGNTNPIYTIGSSYTPSDTSLINMYGIGYAHPNLWGSGKTSSWGLYVCEAATINATIGGGAVTIWAQNDIVAYSDIRVKDNIEVIPNAISKVQALRGVTFTRIDAKEEDRNKRHAGVIAQEVLAVHPEVVSGTEKDMYSVAYGNMAGLFIEAFKEQQAQIEKLTQTVSQLSELLNKQ